MLGGLRLTYKNYGGTHIYIPVGPPIKVGPAIQ